MTWRNRIVGYGEAAPDTLLAHEHNWRLHPRAQQQALLAVMREVGIVQNVLCSQRSGRLLDGHLRVQLARHDDQPTVPVTYVDVSLEEEAYILATLDPLAALADASAPRLATLLGEVSSGESAVQQLLSDLAAKHHLWPQTWLDDPDEAAPSAFETVEDVTYDYRCPKCEHTWSGEPK